jgi:hypothetical protein
LDTLPWRCCCRCCPLPMPAAVALLRLVTSCPTLHAIRFLLWNAMRQNRGEMSVRFWLGIPIQGLYSLQPTIN